MTTTRRRRQRRRHAKPIAAISFLCLLMGACTSGGSGDVRTDATGATGAANATAEPTGSLTLAAGPLPAELDELATTFSKHIDVWGVDIVGTPATDDAALTHAANVMAQYLDNDADGVPDDPAVIDRLRESRAILLMAATPDEFESVGDDVFDALGDRGGQDLYASETAPENGFDASLEEVHHLLLNFGWAQVHPDELGQAKGSAIADAMDIARGGQFDDVPTTYPDDAWYTYDDRTCDYVCMVTEYTYWAHTSLLGAQADRADEIGNEWRLATPSAVRETDVAATEVLEDLALGLPTVLPDGTYTG